MMMLMLRHSGGVSLCPGRRENLCTHWSGGRPEDSSILYLSDRWTCGQRPSMDECLRRVCPCLETLWRRSSGEKQRSAGGAAGAGAAGGADGSGRDRPPVDEASHSGSLREVELSLHEGDLFRVTSRSGDRWSVRKLDKDGRVLETGIVPNSSLVRAESPRVQPWYFGKMNRFEAQSQLLGAGNEDGSFLIRHSEKDHVGYVLSVRSSSRVKHFKIHHSAGRFFVERTQSFSSLVELVQHYSTNSLINTGQLGCLCRRTEPDTAELNHFSVDEWELPREDFTLEEELGTGYFADVYRGRWKKHVSVAIKIIKSDSELNHCEFQKEVQILKRLRHCHLISLFGVCTASTPYYIITELMEKGSLLTFLRGPEGALQDSAALVDMGAQVADGMSYLEEQNSIHRDLAARNVLVGGNYICKVADFGLARVIKEPFYISVDRKIPYKWSAPEAISHGKFSSKSDVWSFGVLLYEIVTYGGVPYPALSNQEVFQQVTKGYRMPAPPKCPDFLYSIMSQCWRLEPDQRPHFKSLKVQLDASLYEME